MNKGIHRVTADSRRGRSLISTGTNFCSWAVPKEIAVHNAEIDRKKAEKRARKEAKK